MKNFLELLDINCNITVDITLNSIIDNGAPYATVHVNGVVILEQEITQEGNITTSVPLLDPINIQIGMSNKQYSADIETALLIKSVCIDGTEMIPKYVHYAHYTNEHNIDTPTSYLGVNGIWELDIPKPFYNWKHEILHNGWLLQP